MKTQTLLNSTFEVYAQARHEALEFFRSHSVVPDTVYISGDGWIEAVYHVESGDKSILRMWNQLERDGHAQLAGLPYYNDQTSDCGRITVHFKPMPPVKSVWSRLKQLAG